MSLAIFGITNSGLNLAVSLLVLMLRRRLAGSDRLHLPRRPAPPLRPVPGRLRDDRLLLPLRRHRRLRDRPAAGVPRGRPRARAGDQGRRAAGAPADRALLPQLRVPGREELPALSQLPAPPQGPLPDLRQAGRPPLEPLPVLRDRAAARGAPAERGERERPRARRAAHAARGPVGRGARRAGERRRPKPVARKKDPRPAKKEPATRAASKEAPTPKREQRSPSREPDPDPRQA